MKNQKVISIFVTLLTLMTVIFSLGMTSCKADAVLSQLKTEKGLKDAKQWMVIKEDVSHDYLVLASQTSTRKFRKDKARIVNGYMSNIIPPYLVPASSDYAMYHVIDKDNDLRIKSVNVDPGDTNWWDTDNHNQEIANSIQIYNTLRGVAETIE